MKRVFVCHSALFGMLFALVSACSSTPGKVLVVDSGKVPAADHYQPGEIRAMMESLGYRFIADPDPAKTTEMYREYRQYYRLRSDERIRVDVHIRMLGDRKEFWFRQEGRDAPDANAMQYYRALRDRLELQFGAPFVREGRLRFGS